MEVQTDIKSAVADLEALMGNLNDSDRKFADSLINGPYGYKKRQFLSEKQKPYVFKLLNTAMGIVRTDKPVIGDLAGITAMFNKAKAHIKYPAIVLGLTDGLKVKIWVQGSRAKYPGAIGVTVNGNWVGRIHTDGTFQGSRAFAGANFQDELIDLLTQLAKDPEGVASQHGKLHSKCCFCNLPLKDEKSLAVGYGPVCADHFGLQWGVKTLNIAQAIQ